MDEHGEKVTRIAVDPARRICAASPRVTFLELVAATLPYELVPMVVPDLSTSTLGGAVTSCTLGSTSFRAGTFEDTCLSSEIASETLTCRLVPATPFVHITYEPYATLDGYLAAIDVCARNPGIDFLDGIVHAPDELVLCLGRFVDRAPFTSHYDRDKPYAESTRTRGQDYLDTPHYLFRYEPGVAQESALMRLAHWLRRRRRVEPPAALDALIPRSRVPRFLAWYERDVCQFPLRCVPYRSFRAADVDDALFLWATDARARTLDVRRRAA